MSIDIPITLILLAGAAVFLIALEVTRLVLEMKERVVALEMSREGAGASAGGAYGGMLKEDRLRVKIVLAIVTGGGFTLLGLTQLAKLQNFSVAGSVLFLMLIGVSAYVSFVVPDKIFHFIYERRLEKMNHQLIDAMNVLAMALRSGRTLEGALPLVAQQIPAPLSMEFERAVQEINVGGVLLEEALRRLAVRVPFKDMHIFVSTMLIVHTIGGSQAEILDKNATLIRERFRIKQKIHSLTAEGRFSAFAIALAPVFVLLVNFLIDPETMTAFVSNPIGMLILCAIGVSDYIGYTILSKLVRIEF